MSIQSLPGFRDFLPQEAKKRLWLKNLIVSVFEKWGYEPMETPTLEPLSLFAGQVGEDEKLFFKFTDNGGREVALRYDQTVPTCKVVGENASQLVFPFKRYQIQSAFRAEKPQKGRYREFLQCDADIFGISSPLADAEVIALSLDIYKQIGFKQVKALINDRALLSDFPYEAIIALDKLDKIGPDGVISDMVAKGISQTDAKKFLEKTASLQPNETVKTIMNYLSSYGFDASWFEFSPTIARSFSYSTGIIWEIIIPNLKGSVLGGERFDKLVEKTTGKNIPGVGFGLGFDRTLEASETMGLIPEMLTASQVLVTIFSQELFNNSLKITRFLRQNNINCELYPESKIKLDKQLKYANDKKIPFAIIIGPDEIKTNSVTLKNLNKKSQVTIPLSDVVHLINESSQHCHCCSGCC